MKIRPDGTLDLTPQEHLRVRWLALPAVIGALLLGGAEAADVFAHWTGVDVSIMVNAGTALGLASAIFLMQRRMVQRVAEAVRGTCSLTDPHTDILRLSLYDGEIVWACGHRPQHRWDLSGARLQDWEPA